MANNRPEATFRLGNIYSSFFVSESKAKGRLKREFRTTNLRHYHRIDNKTRSANRAGAVANAIPIVSESRFRDRLVSLP